MRRIASVPEPAMRLALWSECFADLPTPELLDLVREVERGMTRLSQPHRWVYAALLRYLAGSRPSDESGSSDYEARRALYEAARAAGDERIARLLLSPPRQSRADPDPREYEALLKSARDITLGERRAMARRYERDVFTRLLFDPDPGVVRNLLANPRLTESDVLQMASRRPTVAETLRAISTHPRWGDRRAVLRAVVLNPHTATDLAVRLLAMLDGVSVREIARDTSVSAGVRARARQLLQERTQARRERPC